MDLICHSERSEESQDKLREESRNEILRSFLLPQNDIVFVY
jgi:hypothetical protein